MKNTALLFFAMLFIACNSEKKEISKQEEAVELKNADSESIESYDFEAFEPFLKQNDDKTYVINFWATWCKPCVEELPYFEKVNQEWKEKNVEVLLVSLDFPKHIDTKVIPFLKKNNISSKVVLLDDPDQNAWIPKIDSSWSGAIPATIIYNKSGMKFYEQPFTYEELSQEINSFLKP